MVKSDGSGGMARPLDGIRRLEVAARTFLRAAPAAILADLRADVIKIEPPNGDPLLVSKESAS